MNIKENCFIFSTWLDRYDIDVNMVNHNFVKASLDRARIAYKEVKGMYKGKEEMSFIVIGLKNEEAIREYCQVFAQESYIMIHNDQTADLKLLVPSGIATERLGRFVSVPDSVNISDLNAWTKDLSSGQYFYIVK